MAYQVKYDSVHNKFPGTIAMPTTICINGCGRISRLAFRSDRSIRLPLPVVARIGVEAGVHRSLQPHPHPRARSPTTSLSGVRSSAKSTHTLEGSIGAPTSSSSCRGGEHAFVSHQGRSLKPSAEFLSRLQESLAITKDRCLA